MAIRIDDERRQDLIGRLRAFFFIVALGSQVYNQAVQDARAFMQRKLEDLEGDVYAGPAQ